MVWGAGGWMNGLANPAAGIKAIDFAGGLVVHMTSGWSALILCLIVGKRHGHGREPMPPHSMVFCMVGTGMLWAGWYGFNAGSALAADGVAVNAFVTTTLSAAAGCFSWSPIEYFRRGKPSVLGLLLRRGGRARDDHAGQRFRHGGKRGGDRPGGWRCNLLCLQ